MDVNDARTFVALVENGSVSRAASVLHVTQPAVTRRIQRFEQAIGAPLIDRRSRPLTLTAAGREAIERCRRLISAAEELRSLAQGEAMPSREVRIGIAHALSEVALTEPLDRLREEFPSVVLRLHTGWGRELLQKLRSGALDAAVVLLPEGDGLPAGLSGERLAAERLEVIAPRSPRIDARRIHDLDDKVWVLSPDGCFARTALQRELGRQGVALRISVETYNYDLQLALVSRGRGLGLVPKRMLQRSPSKTGIRTLQVRGLEFPVMIWMATGEPPPGLASPIAALGGYIAERLGKSSRPTRRRSG